MSKFQKIQKPCMAKSRNRIKAGRKNAKKQWASKSNNENDFDASSAGDDDEYQPSIKRRRKFQNQRSMCWTEMGVLESIFSKYCTCRACNIGTLNIDITQYNKLNAHIILICDHCGIEHREWMGPKNFNESALMAGKYSGIKTGQLENFARLTNMGFTNNNGKHFAVNLFKENTQEMNRDLNIKLDQMKKADEQKILEEVLADKTAEVEYAADGMYPIKSNSGICVSSIMAKINGQNKIIGKNIKNGKIGFTVFFENHSFFEKQSSKIR